MQCDMKGFILQYGSEENLSNLTLNFPPDGPVIPDDYFVPKGTFLIIPPVGGIRCGNTTIDFKPFSFSGLPEEQVVRYTLYY